MWQKIWQNKFIILLILLAVTARIYAIFQPAQPYDMGTYQAWARLLPELGPTRFFATTWSDYLPLPIYLFSLLTPLAALLHLPFAIVFKSFFTLLELGLLFWLFRLLHSLFPRSPYILYTISYLLLSPALIGNTSWWGQTDSLPALLTALSLSYFLKSLSSPSSIFHFSSAILFSLAVSFKPIVLLTLPVFAILYFTSPRRPPFLHTMLYFLFSIFIFLAPALFVDSNPIEAFRFLLAKATEQASTYPFTSINAFNLWTLRSSLTSWPPDNQIVLGISAQTFGNILFAVFSFFTLRHWHRAKWDRKYVFRVAGTLLITFYTVTTRMHERHLLFGLPFLALASLKQPWLLLPYSLFTILYSFNLWAAYQWVINSQTWPTPIIWANLASWLTTLTTFGLVLVWDWQAFLRRTVIWLKRNRNLALILTVGLFMRLFLLSHPPVHIFDEVYHAFTAQVMVQNDPAAWEWWNSPPEGFAYEWTHPPLAKYGMVAGLLLFGDNSFGWRFFSAIFGIFSIFGIYSLSKALKLSRSTALIAAFLLTIEGLHFVQSRIGMNDIYLLTFLVWSLERALSGRWKSAAVLYGLALASKWSALYGVIPLALVYLHQFFPQLKQSFLASVRCSLFVVRLLLTSLLTYLLSYSPFFLSGHTWAQFVELHRQMWYYHTNLVATHTYQSSPWQWLLSVRPVWYWVEYDQGQLSNIYAQGNPLILWLGLVALIFTLPKIRQFPHFLLIVLYSVFTIPWLFSPRIMFFYHYLPSAAFLTIILAAWLSSLSRRSRIVLLLVCSLVFALLSPLYYGFALPTWYWDSLFSLFPSWK